MNDVQSSSPVAAESLCIVRSPIAEPCVDRRVVRMIVERRQLARRVWRGRAEDGVEFGFELERPLRHGETFWQEPAIRYEISQQVEPVLAVALDTLPPSAAAGVGWAVGNLHLELQSEAGRLLTPDEPAGRQLLDRLGLSFRSELAVFRPGHFVRGVTRPAHELGSSHRH